MPRTRSSRGRAWTSLAVGALIVAIPVVFGATSERPYFALADTLTGAIVIVLAAIAVWAARNNLVTLASTEGVNALLGLWAIAIPLIFRPGLGAVIANVLLGTTLAIVAGWDAYVGAARATRSAMVIRRA